jgi:hypothetical protein
LSMGEDNDDMPHADGDDTAWDVLMGLQRSGDPFWGLSGGMLSAPWRTTGRNISEWEISGRMLSAPWRTMSRHVDMMGGDKGQAMSTLWRMTSGHFDVMGGCGNKGG